MKVYILSFILLILLTNYIYCQWEPCNGPIGTEIISLSANEKYLVAGTYDNGIFISTDNGDTWIQNNKGLKNAIISSVVVTNDTIIVGNGDGGIFIINSVSDTWESRNSGLHDTNDNFILSLVNDGRYLYTGTDHGLFKSSDHGESWEKINTGAKNQIILSIAISGDTIAFGNAGGALYVSTNYGINWHWTWKDFHLNDNPNCLAIVDKWIFAGTHGGCVMQYFFEGDTLDVDTLGTNQGWVYDIFNIGNTVIIAASTGVFYSSKHGRYGSIWLPLNTGLPYKKVFSLAHNDKYIFAGTIGEGVYRIKLSSLGITEMQEYFNHETQIELYPNPADDKIILRRLNGNINENFLVFNIFGNIVLLGSLNFDYNEIDISGLPKGIYYVRTGNQIKKLIKN